MVNSILKEGVIREKTGAYNHTEGVVAYQLHEMITLVDFPGVNSLNAHAQLYSYLGNINNLTVLVIRYDGNLNEHIVDEIIKVLSASIAGSGRAKMMLCLNKCVPDILDHAKEENMSLEEFIEKKRASFAEPIVQAYNNRMKKGYEFAKERFKEGFLPFTKSIGAISDGYATSVTLINDIKQGIFFTEWHLDDKSKDIFNGKGENRSEKARRHGIMGLADIKLRIKKTLNDLDIVKRKDFLDEIF